MQLTKLAAAICEEISELTIVDAHEHLPSEADYLRHRYSGANLFAGGYIQHDLESAGMPNAFKQTLRDDGFRPVEQWWPQIRPFWQAVRHTSFSRALLVAARDLYGIPDINDETIHTLAECVVADNTPGLYQRILQDRCHIHYSITCVDQVAFPADAGLRGLSTCMLRIFDAPLQQAFHMSTKHMSAADLLAALTAHVTEMLQEDLNAGAVGIKIGATDFAPPDAKQAVAEAVRAVVEGLPVRRYPHLRDWLFDACCNVAVQFGVPIAVHTGYWGDFRLQDPKLLLGVVLRRRDVQFDLFHLGMPMIRDCIMMGKTCPNVTLNLTWCPIISQMQTYQALGEIIDMVPLSKVIAFGGDYRACVQKVWGHLTLARECVAASLADRVAAGEFSHDEAIRIARLWFHDNPMRIYHLQPDLESSLESGLE